MIALIGVGHCLSHFFQLVLPPLFPLLKDAFGVSYATLGAVMSVFYVSSGACQFGAGFAVDRFGSRPVLLIGLALLAGSTFAAGFVPDIAWLFPLAALMGIGNGVFHPANFAVLNASVDPRRLGHAYSVHGIGGSLGYAIAPVVSYGLATAVGWRHALLLMGAAGIVALGVIATQRAVLVSRAHGAARPTQTLRETVSLFAQAPILLCFGYFVVLTTATVGIQTFAGTALNAAYGIPMGLATSALTAYFLGSTSGILAGGFLATHTERHDRVAATGLATGGVLMMGVASLAIAGPWMVALFAVIGFALGATGPSRDMIVRRATPPGASGRVYGFVYSGLDLGATIGPLWLGMLLDHDAPRGAFFAIAACLFVAILTVVQVRRSTGLAIAAARSASNAAD